MRIRNVLVLALVGVAIWALLTVKEEDLRRLQAWLVPYSDARFVQAVKDHETELIASFLARTDRVNARDIQGNAVLHWAALRHNRELAETLLERGAEVNLRGSYGRTPLVWAAQQGDLEMVRTLLKHDARADLADEGGLTALGMAVYNGHFAVVQTLLRAGVPADVRGDNQSDTALHIALRQRDEAMVGLLLERGADPLLTDRQGRSGLSLALEANLVPLIRETCDSLEVRDQLSSLTADVIENGDERPDFDEETLAQHIHAQTNQVRVSHGLEPLTYDPELARVARAHACDMGKHGYFGHLNLQGETPTDRARRMGYPTEREVGPLIRSGIAENLFQGQFFRSAAYHVEHGARHITYLWFTQDGFAQDAVQAWLDSPGHRKNLLDPHSRVEGIGVEIVSDTEVYVTQNLQ